MKHTNSFASFLTKNLERGGIISSSQPARNRAHSHSLFSFLISHFSILHFRNFNGGRTGVEPTIEQPLSATVASQQAAPLPNNAACGNNKRLRRSTIAPGTSAISRLVTNSTVEGHSRVVRGSFEGRSTTATGTSCAHQQAAPLPNNGVSQHQATPSHNNTFLRKVAMLLCVLMLGLGQMWGATATVTLEGAKEKTADKRTWITCSSSAQSPIIASSPSVSTTGDYVFTSGDGKTFIYDNTTYYNVQPYQNGSAKYWGNSGGVTYSTSFTIPSNYSYTISSIAYGIARMQDTYSASIVIEKGSSGVYSINNAIVGKASNGNTITGTTVSSLSTKLEAGTYTLKVYISSSLTGGTGKYLGLGKVVLSGNLESAAPTTHYAYLKNTMNWTNAYAYFYGSSSYWDTNLGSGSSGRSGAVTMTYDNETGLFKCETTQNGGYVVFTKDKQDNYDKFYNTEAIYFNNNFQYDKVVVVAAQSSEPKNGTKYYASPNVSNIEYQTLDAASGTGYFLPGGFNGWETKGNEFVKGDGTDITYTKDLSANTTYEFKVYHKGEYRGNNGTMTSDNCSGWTMSTDANNCKITTGLAGTYIFTYNTSTNKLSVTYPTPKYSVTYLAGGGSGTVPTQADVSSGTQIALASASGLSKTGYSFDGWLCNINSAKYNAGAPYTMTAANTTFTAQWTGTTPSFSAQPQGATYNQNASATPLSVTASANGGALSYQWQSSSNGTSGWTNVSNGTSSTYTPSTATVGDMYYHCVVTNTTGNKSATSTAAKITVKAIQFANSVEFATEAEKSSPTDLKQFLDNNNYSYTFAFSKDNGASWDAPADKPADHGLKIKAQDVTLSFYVPAGYKVTMTFGTLAGAGGGKISVSTDGGSSYTDYTGAATASTGTPVSYDFTTTATTQFFIKTKSSKWNIINAIKIAADLPPATKFTVSGPSSLCDANPQITLSGSQSGVDYQLYKDNVASGAAKAGTGTALTWSISAAGTYTVKSVENATYAATPMNGSVTVVAGAAPTISSKTVVVAGTTSTWSNTSGLGAPYGSKNTYVSVACSEQGVTYQWYKTTTKEAAEATVPTEQDLIDKYILISGATSNTYSLENDEPSIDYYYYCCKVSNGCGSTITNQSCRIMVYSLVTDWTFDETEIKVKINESVNLTGKIYPETARFNASSGFIFTATASKCTVTPGAAWPEPESNYQPFYPTVTGTVLGEDNLTVSVSSAWYDRCATDEVKQKTCSIAVTVYDYIVTLNFDNGTANQVIYNTNASGFTLPTPEKTGYDFIGWYNGDVKVADGGDTYVPTADITLTAHWQQKAYTVTAVVNPAGYGTLDNDQITNIQDGTSISVDGTDSKILHVGSQTITATPADPTAQYTYDFSSWSWTDDVTTVTKNITATATFTRSARTYNITYMNIEGCTWNGEHITQYTCATTTTLPTNIEHTNWIFLDWYDNSGLTGDPVTEIGTDAYGDKTFYAKWDKPQCADMLIYDGSTMTNVPTGNATGRESTSGAYWECKSTSTNTGTISKTYEGTTYTRYWQFVGSKTGSSSGYIKVVIPEGYKATVSLVGFLDASHAGNCSFITKDQASGEPIETYIKLAPASDGTLVGATSNELAAGTYYLCASGIIYLTKIDVQVCEGSAQICTTPTISWVNAPEDAVVGAAPMTATVTTNQSNPTITWESTNPNVATVSDGGSITYVGAGNTTIKAHYQGSGNFCDRKAEITNDITVAPIWTVYTNMQNGTDWADVAINAQNQASITPAQRGTQYRFLLRKQVKSDTSADGAYVYYGATGENNYDKDQSGQPWTLDGTTDVNLSVTAKDDYLFQLANLEETSPQITVTFPTAYTISFNGNGFDGGTAMTAITNLATGDTETLPANTYEKHCFEFMGWATSSTGEVVYRDQADVTVASADIELFAVWSSAKYTVTFDANGGTVSPTTAKQARTNGTVQMLVPTRDGYSCTGWYSSAEGGVLVAAAGAYYIPQSDITVYAHWEDLSTNWVIKGSWDNWGTPIPFVKKTGETGSIAYATVPMTGTWQQFKLNDGTEQGWYSYNYEADKITKDNCTNWTLYTDNNNSEITMDGEGNYTFRLDYSGTNPVISVAYPVWQLNIHHSLNITQSVVNFTQSAPTDWIINNFVVPTYDGTGDNPGQLWVGPGKWIDKMSANWWPRWILLNQYAFENIGHGVEGAVGTLHINPFANSENYGLRFDPAGYGFVYGSGSGVGNLTASKPFAQKQNDPAVWNTPGEELTADLKAAKFYVGLATQTAGSYKFSYDYGSEGNKECNGLSQVASVGDIKVWNEADPQYWTSTVSSLSDGTHGHFQIWADNAAQKNFYIHYIIDNKLTFDLNGATSPASIDPMYVGQNLSGEDCNVTLPSGLTRTGYDFAGWKIDGVAYAAGATYALVDDATAVAQWTPQTYTITFDANGGTIDGNATKVMSYTYDGEELTLPTTDDREGYTFANWWTARTDGSQIDNVGGSNKPTANTTYYAHWTANQYTLTLYKNDGTGTSTTVQVTYDAVCPQTLPDWTRTGYDFDNFYTEAVGGYKITKKDGDTWKFEGSDFAYTKDAKWHYADNDAVLYAHWKAHQNKLTFNLDGGTGYTTQNKVDFGTEINVSTDPVKTGHTFTGWTATGITLPKTGIFTMPDNDVTLTAGWSINSYTLTWAGIEDATVTGGTPAGSVAYETAITAPTVSKTGYDFTGWDPAVVSPMPASDKTYTAQWTAIEYTITYNDVEGATHTNPATYTIETPTITLQDASKSDFNFLGWYDDSENKVTSIAQGTTGNISLTAKWAKELLTPTIKDWTDVPTKVYKGGKYTFTVSTNSDADLSSCLSVTAGTGASVNTLSVSDANGDGYRTITAALTIDATTAAGPFSITLDIPDGDTYKAASETKSNITLGDCSEPTYEDVSIYSFTVTSSTTATNTYTATGGTAVLSGSTMSTGGSNEMTIGSQTFYMFNSSAKWTFTLASGTFAVGDKIVFTCACNTSSDKSGKGVKINESISVTGGFPKNTANNITYTVVANDGVAGKSSFDIIRADSDIKFGTVNVTRKQQTGSGDGPQEPELAWADGQSAREVTFGDDDFSLTAQAVSAGNITYAVTEGSAVTISDAGNVHIVAAGTATISASIAANGCYTASATPISYTITVNKLPLTAPTVTTTDEDATYYDCEKDDAQELTVTATNVDTHDGSTLSYQWYKDNVAISGATTDTYTPTATGSYKCTVTCSLDDNYESASASSDAKTITFYPATTFTTNPVSATYTKGELMTDLTVMATGGNGGFTYQWQESANGTDWTNSSKEGNQTATLIMGTAVNDGSTPIITYYRCLVYTNGKCETASESATITINSKNVETLTWTGLDKTFYAGGQYTISVAGVHACPTWTTSDNVDELANAAAGNTRTVTFVIKDNVTAVAFTASIEEDETYFGVNETKNLNMGACASAPDPQLTWSGDLENEHVFNVAPNAKLTTYTASSNSVSAGTISYASNNTDVVTVNAATGEVTLVADATGDATITATQAASGCFSAASITYKVVVRKQAEIYISGKNTANQGEKVVLNITTNSTATPTVSRVSGSGVTLGDVQATATEGEYTVDVIFAANATTATIKASVADNGEYTSATSANHQITVTACTAEPITKFSISNMQWTSSLSLAGGASVTLGQGDYKATISGGSVIVKNLNSGSKGALGKGTVSFGSNDVYMGVTLDEPLKEGDVISITGANVLGLSTNEAEVRPVTSPATSDGTYTITANDGLAGSSTLCFWRPTSSTVSISAATISSMTEAATITTTLEWDPAISGDITVPYNSAVPQHVAHQTDATASSGAITYESSNEDVVTVDAATGEITQVGYGTATITATMAEIGCYKSATTSYTITFVDCANQPTILAPTEDKELTYTEGTNVILQVNAVASAEDLALSYQWYKDNEAVDGATAALYEFTASDATAGVYYCEVSETDGCKSPKSATITIVVVPDEPTCGHYESYASATLTSTTEATVVNATAVIVELDNNSGYRLKTNDKSKFGLTLLDDDKFHVGDKITFKVKISDYWKGENPETLPIEIFGNGDKSIYTSDNYAKNTDNVEVKFDITQDMITAGLTNSIYAYRTSTNTQNHRMYSVTVERETCDEGLMQFMDFTGDGKWSTEANWMGTSNPAKELPTAGTITQIKKSVLVDKADAMSARVDLYDNSQLEIASTAALQVTGTIKRADKSATTVNDIYIHSDASGTGALVFDNSDGSDKAIVEYYSIASGAPTNTQWQWATTPYSDETDVQYNYYGAWLSPWDNSTKGWGAMMKNGDGMTPFWGYCISRKEAGTFWMQGTLVSTDDRIQELDYNSTIKASRAGLNIIGNSWSAPINIAQWEVSDFVNAQATIVILNTGMDSLGSGSVGTNNSEAGQYISIPVKASKLMNSNLQVIPSMQAFQVRATGTSASVQMNYDQLVRKTNGDIDIEPMRAPSRATDNEIDLTEVVTLRMDVKGSRFNDFLYLFQHPQFTDDVDNGWDGEKMLGSEDAVQLYVLPQSGKLAVSAQPELVGTQFGFYKGEDESYTITFDYNGTEQLYLYDANTDTYTEIKNGNSYTFSSYTTNLEKRFSITNVNPYATIVTDDEEVRGADEMLFKYVEDEHLKIRLNERIIDGTGQMLNEVK